MKWQVSVRGYVRTVLLSITAACAIEAVVNADEVSAAFAAGKSLKKANAVLQDSTVTWLKIPQHISKGVGRFYHDLFEVKSAL